MKHSMRITILVGSLFLWGDTITALAEAQPDKDKSVQEKLEREKKETSATREIDMTEIFGDPDLLDNGESIRSVAEPLPAWKIYCMSWGAWVAVRCETALEYIKKAGKTFKERVFALMGLYHAEQKRQKQQA